jgi:methylated-DNA-[protein]-cysteine S-methyltransferase
MKTTKHSEDSPLSLHVFPSDLGWMAILVSGEAVVRLSFGHPSSEAAQKAIGPFSPISHMGPMGRMGLMVSAKGKTDLQLRLQAYAAGNANDFRDICVDPGLLQPALTDFQLRVLKQCRKIPFGRTISYAELAAKAGSPRAARAIGNCMAANPIPLLIPCHRVVRSDGQLGSYSAPGGVGMKRRLLALES